MNCESIDLLYGAIYCSHNIHPMREVCVTTETSVVSCSNLLSTVQTYAVYEFNLRDGGLDGTILENDMKPFARVIIGAVAMLKAFSWQGILATSPQVAPYVCRGSGSKLATGFHGNMRISEIVLVYDIRIVINESCSVTELVSL